MNNEELQSRREFFKKAAKAAIPVVAAVVLTNVPTIAKAVEPMGCDNSCYYGCDGTCTKTCQGYCRWGCKTTCEGGCYGHNY